MEKDAVLVCMVLGFLGSVAVTLGFVANNYSSKAWIQDRTSQFSFHQFDRSVLTKYMLVCAVQRDELRVPEPAGDGSRHPGGVPGVHQPGLHPRDRVCRNRHRFRVLLRRRHHHQAQVVPVPR
ncbi:hypothetical protein CFC21_035212 [Triticum aestivum]|uniref:Uncharacterized protein n=3 Tax=Triticum TaxID=4564 RepID=A0A9R0RIL5_TRITD|nr:hypothetical protein CFC21_035212 [Triticum aestivum]VAH60621.1 unnamed protein product [Triticum turgidum subsp. durum]